MDSEQMCSVILYGANVDQVYLDIHKTVLKGFFWWSSSTFLLLPYIYQFDLFNK